MPLMRQSLVDDHRILHLYLRMEGRLAIEKSNLDWKIAMRLGVVIKSRQHHSLHSPTGAVAIAVESGRLQATQEAISTPERIMGQRWPGER